MSPQEEYSNFNVQEMNFKQQFIGDYLYDYIFIG